MPTNAPSPGLSILGGCVGWGPYPNSGIPSFLRWNASIERKCPRQHFRSLYAWKSGGRLLRSPISPLAECRVQVTPVSNASQHVWGCWLWVLAFSRLL